MILGAVIALTMFSCGGDVNVNDKIVTVYDKYVLGSEKLLGSLEKGTVEEKQKTLATFETFTDSCATVIKEIKPTKEAEAFHNSILEVYKVMKSDLIPAYQGFVVLDENDESNANVDKYNKAIDKVNEATQKVSDLEDKVMAEQRAFAKAVGMELR
ncbi:MAG: hypothetical protein ACRCVU_07450 [Flavobacterium sp.]